MSVPELVPLTWADIQTIPDEARVKPRIVRAFREARQARYEAVIARRKAEAARIEAEKLAAKEAATKAREEAKRRREEAKARRVPAGMNTKPIRPARRAEHGKTRSLYTAGCRCEPCRRVESDYQAARHVRRKAARAAVKAAEAARIERAAS